MARALMCSWSFGDGPRLDEEPKPFECPLASPLAVGYLLEGFVMCEVCFSGGQISDIYPKAEPLAFAREYFGLQKPSLLTEQAS